MVTDGLSLARTIWRGTMREPGTGVREMSPAKKPLVRTAFFLIAIIALGSSSCAVLVWYSSRGGTDYSRVPLSRSEYLKDVVEPVSMVMGMAFDDGGSHGLVFK